MHIYTASRLDEPVINNRLVFLGKIAADRGYHVTLHGLTTRATGETTSGLRIKSIGLGAEFKSDNFFYRFVYELKLSIILAFHSRKATRNSIHLISIPSLLLLVLLPFFKAGSYIIFDIRDAGWTYLINTRGVKKAIGYFFKFLAKVNLKRGNLITVSNAEELSHVSNDLLLPNVALLSNGISSERFDILSTLVPPNPLESSRRINILYAGNVGQAQKLETVAEYCVTNENLVFTIAGTGSNIEDFRANYERYGNIEILGALPWDELVQVYTKADILLVKIAAEYTSAVPSKLYECVAIGKPIILMANGEAAKLASQFNLVWVVGSESVVDLSVVITEILSYDSCDNSHLIEENRNRLKRFYLRDQIFHTLLDDIEIVRKGKTRKIGAAGLR